MHLFIIHTPKFGVKMPKKKKNMYDTHQKKEDILMKIFEKSWMCMPFIINNVFQVLKIFTFEDLTQNNNKSTNILNNIFLIIVK